MHPSSISVDAGQQDPLFEFVNGNSNGQNMNRILAGPNGTTQIETLSDILAVATPSSLGQTGPALPGPFLSTNNWSFNGNHSMTNPQLIDPQAINFPGGFLPPQRNSPLIDPTSTSAGTNNPTRSQTGPNNRNLSLMNHQHRFPAGSGLELLLLISSLMFLVLLALALITSYYCFQRRRRRHVSSRAALAPHTSGHFVSTGGYSNPGLHSSQDSIQHHYNNQQYQHQQHQQNRKLNSRLNSFWTPGPEAPVMQGRSTLAHSGQQQALIDQLIQANWPVEGRQAQRVPGTHISHLGAAKLTRWPPEAQLVEAHLRAQAQGPPQVPGYAPYQSMQRQPRHTKGGPDQVPYALVEPRYQQQGPRSQDRSGFAANNRRSHQQLYYANGKQEELPAGEHRDSSQRQVAGEAGGSLWRTKSWISERTRSSEERHLTEAWANSVSSGSCQGSSSFKGRPQKADEQQAGAQSQHRVSFAARSGPPLSPSNETESPFSEDSDEYCQEAALTGHQGPMSPESPPRLLVKSIEDSYIRKLTEIESQEYLSRDSRQSLSLAEWRALIAEKQRNFERRSDTKTKGPEVQAGEIQINVRSRQNESLDDYESWPDSGDASGSNLANLRSLSEVDISFARPAGALSQQRDSETFKRAGSNSLSSGSSTNEAKPGAKEQSADTQVKEVPGGASEPAQAPKPLETDSPDLILSPDYRLDDESFQQARRLQLRPQTGAKSPDGSVSYV